MIVSDLKRCTLYPLIRIWIKL